MLFSFDPTDRSVDYAVSIEAGGCRVKQENRRNRAKGLWYTLLSTYGLVEEYLRMRDPKQTATDGVLHLNAASPLMRHLLNLSRDSEAFTAALEIVYHNARFFAGRALTAPEAKLGFDMISYSVEQLVRSVEPPPDAGKG
jgi:hypothetical protein